MGAWRAQRFVVGDLSSGIEAFAGEGCLGAPNATPDFTFTLTAPNQMTVSLLPADVYVPAVTSCFGVSECDDIFVINDGTCNSRSCGICSCSFEFNGISGTGGFGVTGTTLSLTVTSAAACIAGTANCTVRFDYCVRPDGVLDLRDADGSRFEMTRM